MGQPVGLLSGGQRQALTLLMSTMVPPKILLLDEHTAALDPGTAEKVLNITRGRPSSRLRRYSGLKVMSSPSSTTVPRSGKNTPATAWNSLDPGTAEKVLNITREVVAEHKITTMMVTHNMHQALELGNRTLMMDSGRIGRSGPPGQTPRPSWPLTSLEICS